MDVAFRFRHLAPALALVACWGCAASILGDDPETGLTVAVTRGPIQPVAREGEVNEEPVAGAKLAVRADAGGSAHVVTASDGTAALNLIPGDYRVVVSDCPGALVLPAEADVRVTEGQMASLSLSCDTGIR